MQTTILDLTLLLAPSSPLLRYSSNDHEFVSSSGSQRFWCVIILFVFINNYYSTVHSTGVLMLIALYYSYLLLRGQCSKSLFIWETDLPLELFWNFELWNCKALEVFLSSIGLRPWQVQPFLLLCKTFGLLSSHEVQLQFISSSMEIWVSYTNLGQRLHIYRFAEMGWGQLLSLFAVTSYGDII